MQNWREDSDLTEPNESSDERRAGVLGDMRKNDTVVMEFHDDGEFVDRDGDNAVAFRVTLLESSTRLLDWDRNDIDEGEDFVFETRSSALLSVISEMDTEGHEIAITRNKEGASSPDGYYDVEANE